MVLFRDELGCRYLGNWADRDSNSYIEAGLLSAYLTKRGYSRLQINSALYRLRLEAVAQIIAGVGAPTEGVRVNRGPGMGFYILDPRTQRLASGEQTHGSRASR